MESNYINESKQNYAAMLIANGKTDRAQSVIEKDAYSPVFEVRESHPQAEPEVKDLNEMIVESYTDLNALIAGFRDCGYQYYNLMKSTKERLDFIKSTLLVEKDKQEDINILCNKYTDFNNVIILDNSNLYGSYSYNNGILSAKSNAEEKISYAITSIDGNGYEGNNYVYRGDYFLNQKIKTNNRDNIKDDSILTLYEYSRITASNSEKILVPDINIDSVEAKCTITISSKSAFNKIIIKLSSKDTILNDLLVSNDNVNYKSVLNKPINMFNDFDKYGSSTIYIANSGLLCFPATNYLKIVLSSNGVTDDIIAFERTIVKGFENSNSNSSSDTNSHPNDINDSYNEVNGSISNKNDMNYVKKPVIINGQYSSAISSSTQTVNLSYDAITKKIRYETRE